MQETQAKMILVVYVFDLIHRATPSSPLFMGTVDLLLPAGSGSLNVLTVGAIVTLRVMADEYRRFQGKVSTAVTSGFISI